jgi:DNA polymerase I-like protein with 3'-5' exonuclease and polymerase domains
MSPLEILRARVRTRAELQSRSSVTLDGTGAVISVVSVFSEPRTCANGFSGELDDGAGLPQSKKPSAHVESSEKTELTETTSSVLSEDISDNSVFSTSDPIRLQKAVRAAFKTGAKFRIVGADVAIEGDLAPELREALPADRLYAYLGAADDDQAAIEFLARLKVTAVLVTAEEQAEEVMAQLDGAELIGLDFETGSPNARPEPVGINTTGIIAANQPKPSKAGLDPYVSVIQTAQLYAGGDTVYVFRGEALDHLSASDWFYRQQYVAHGADFETKFIQHRAGRIPTHPIECNLQATGLLSGVEDRSRSLANASKVVLGVEPPKALQVSCWSAPRLSEGQVSYAAADAVLVYRLWKKLQPELRRKARYPAYLLQAGAVPAVVDMELRGMGFDRDRHAQLVAEWKAEISELEQRIIALTGKPAPTKLDDVQEWIASVAGDLLPTWPRTKKLGLLSTTAADYARLENVPAAKLVLELRARKTLLANFGDTLAKFINAATGRIHAHYVISGSKAGRFTCNSPNLQQQPGRNKAATYKNVFVAAPGHVLIAGDWKQVELRAMAYISGDPTMTAIFEAGGDLHLETALAMTGKKREELSTEELAQLRAHAKAVNFGTIYGITGKGWAEVAWKNYGIKMTVEEGDQAIARFFEKYPRVKQWMQKSLIESTRLGRIKIGAGRVVEIGWELNHQFRPQQAANLPIQGACADAMLRALKLTHERLRDANVTGGIVACIHDEILLEVTEADANTASQILESAMTESFETTFPGAPTTGGVVEIRRGPSWGELEPVLVQGSVTQKPEPVQRKQADPAMLGTSGYPRQELDFYPTEAWVTEALLSEVRFRGTVWEPAAGDGAVVRVLEAAGYQVIASDIVGSGWGCRAATELDFLAAQMLPADVLSIVTNPPYGERGKWILPFIQRALSLTQPTGGMVAVLARNEYDSAKTRRALFSEPPFASKIVLTKRPRWFQRREGDVSPRHNYAWFVWDWQHAGPPHILYNAPK